MSLILSPVSAYGIHPSSELRELFLSKPYQGATPKNAKLIVVGNDANYSSEISDHPFFELILQYHADGVAFWKKHLIHHPFLHSRYPFNKNIGGVTYHRNFSKLGLDSSFADKTSFVELLNVPTIGNTGQNKNLFFEMMDIDHLNWLEESLLGGKKKFVLVNQTLSRNISIIAKKLGVMTKFERLLSGQKPGTIAYRSASIVLFNGYSFSYTVTNKYLASLSSLIRSFEFEQAS